MCKRYTKFRVIGLIVLAILSCQPVPSHAIEATTRPIITDALIKQQVDDLMAKMTPGEKVLQLLSYVPNGVPRLGIPALRAGEALHGVVAGGCTSYPQSIALAATFDPDSIRQMGVYIGAEARAVGVHQAFAPMLGLARDPRWGRVEESYGEDPFLASQMAVAYISGAQGLGDERFGPDKIICTPKHFVADGEPWGGHNGESFDTSERMLREIYLRPFEAAVKIAHCGSLMPAHHQLNGVPCHANHWLLQTVLRDEWEFDGFITSDMSDIPKLGGGHQYANGTDRDPYVLAIKAGVDMELVGKGYQSLLKSMQDGKVSAEVIDQSVRRVLAAKIRLLGIQPPDSANAADQKSATDETIINHKGNDDVWAKLIAEGKFDTPAGARRPDADRVLQDPAHDALALKLARESIVLLKNDGNALPLDRTKLKKILIVGPFGDTENRGGYSGGTSHPYIKLAAALKQSLGDAVQVDFARGCGVESERKPRADKVDFQAVPTIGGDDAQLLAEARARAADADVIIAVVGHSRGQAGENLDRDSLDLVGGQEPLVEAMHATDKPVVVVLENGAPLTIGWIKQNIPAIVESWYGGQDAGRAIADVLLGDYNPGGKLPVTFPKNLGQIPCYYNHLTITGPSDYYQSKWADLFCFGYGLSYTTFAYSNLQITPNAIDARGTAKISATIENTGKRAGDEVVQMYIRQGFTSVERPVEELKGFARVSLQPGEKKTVEFPIGFDQIKFWKDGKWVVEPGDVEIRVGSSSQDIRQKGRLRVGGNPQ